MNSNRLLYAVHMILLSEDSLIGRLIFLRPEQMAAIRKPGLDEPLEERAYQGTDED